MKVLEEFETETGITEDYDPQGDKECGYYSRAFIVEYAEWLEKKLEATLLNNLSIQLPKIKDITDYYCTPGDVESTGYSYISGIHDCYEFMARHELYALNSSQAIQQSKKLPGLEEFIKEAKRFQSEGEKLGGITLIDIIEHLHDFVVRWDDRPIMTFEDARKKLKNVSAADHIPPYAESMLKSFYNIIVGRE